MLAGKNEGKDCGIVLMYTILTATLSQHCIVNQSVIRRLRRLGCHAKSITLHYHTVGLHFWDLDVYKTHTSICYFLSSYSTRHAIIPSNGTVLWGLPLYHQMTWCCGVAIIPSSGTVLWGCHYTIKWHSAVVLLCCCSFLP